MKKIVRGLLKLLWFIVLIPLIGIQAAVAAFFFAFFFMWFLWIFALILAQVVHWWWPGYYDTFTDPFNLVFFWRLTFTLLFGLLTPVLTWQALSDEDGTDDTRIPVPKIRKLIYRDPEQLN